MGKVDVPDGLEEDEAKKALKKHQKRQSRKSGGESKSKRSSGDDDGNWDALIVLGATLVFLGWAADKVIDFVLSLI